MHCLLCVLCILINATYLKFHTDERDQQEGNMSDDFECLDAQA